MTLTLNAIAKLHCAKDRPALTLKDFVRDHYTVGPSFFRDVVSGHRRPSQKLLTGLANAHTRLFPGETILVRIPNYPPVVLGDPANLQPTSK